MPPRHWQERDPQLLRGGPGSARVGVQSGWGAAGQRGPGQTVGGDPEGVPAVRGEVSARGAVRGHFRFVHVLDGGGRSLLQ